MNKSDHFDPQKQPGKRCYLKKHKKCFILPPNVAYMKDIGISYLVSGKKIQPAIQCHFYTVKKYDLLILWKFDSFLMANKCYLVVFAVWPKGKALFWKVEK